MRRPNAGMTTMDVTRRDFDGIPMFLREGTPDATVASSCFGGEFDAICAMLERIDRPSTVLDLGGYIGAAAIRFATVIPHCTVISVEPSLGNFRMLRLNTAGHPNVVAVNAAVGPKRARLPLYARHTGEWGHTLVEEPRDCAEPQCLGLVDVMTVAQILERHSPRGNALSLAKIDIEGSEADVLAVGGWTDGFAIVAAELHDRITEGCTHAWERTFVGGTRFELRGEGEKRVSVDPDLLAALHAPPASRGARTWKLPSMHALTGRWRRPHPFGGS